MSGLYNHFPLRRILVYFLVTSVGRPATYWSEMPLSLFNCATNGDFSARLPITTIRGSLDDLFVLTLTHELMHGRGFAHSSWVLNGLRTFIVEAGGNGKYLWRSPGGATYTITTVYKTDGPYVAEVGKTREVHVLPTLKYIYLDGELVQLITPSGLYHVRSHRGNIVQIEDAAGTRVLWTTYKNTRLETVSVNGREYRFEYAGDLLAKVIGPGKYYEFRYESGMLRVVKDKYKVLYELTWDLNGSYATGYPGIELPVTIRSDGTYKYDWRVENGTLILSASKEGVQCGVLLLDGRRGTVRYNATR